MACMDEQSFSPLGKRLWDLGQWLVTLALLWMGGGESVMRFFASGGRDGVVVTAWLSGWLAASLVFGVAIRLIDKPSVGRRRALACAILGTALWLGLCAWALGIIPPAGRPAAAVLSLGPMVVGWWWLGLKLYGAETPTTGLGKVARWAFLLLFAAMLGAPLLMSFFLEGGWREGGPVLLALFACGCLLMAVLAAFFRPKPQGQV